MKSLKGHTIQDEIRDARGVMVPPTGPAARILELGGLLQIHDDKKKKSETSDFESFLSDEEEDDALPSRSHVRNDSISIDQAMNEFKDLEDEKLEVTRMIESLKKDSYDSIDEEISEQELGEKEIEGELKRDLEEMEKKMEEIYKDDELKRDIEEMAKKMEEMNKRMEEIQKMEEEMDIINSTSSIDILKEQLTIPQLEDEKILLSKESDEDIHPIESPKSPQFIHDQIFEGVTPNSSFFSMMFGNVKLIPTTLSLSVHEAKLINREDGVMIERIVWDKKNVQILENEYQKFEVLIQLKNGSKEIRFRVNDEETVERVISRANSFLKLSKSHFSRRPRSYTPDSPLSLEKMSFSENLEESEEEII